MPRAARTSGAAARRRPPAARRPVALITGASSGIGAALARGLARDGYDLVLVARRAEALQSLALRLKTAHGIRAWVAPADLAQPGAAAALAAAMQRARRPIELLVNNAGMVAHGPFAGQPAALHQQLIALNVAGLTAMLAAFLPGMVARGHGRVLNVASIAAFQPVPMLATYAATKAFVLSLTESLAEELAGSGVCVSALCPGITDTPMLSGAQQASPALARLPGLLIGSAEAVAEQGLRACLQGQVICVPGALNQATILAGRAAPRWLLRRVSGAVARRIK